MRLSSLRGSRVRTLDGETLGRVHEVHCEGCRITAIVAGPAECNAKFAEKKGRWVEGSMCTPCCCKSPNDKADASKGYVYELTTPGSCAGVGECLAGDAEQCDGMMPAPEEKDGKEAPKPRPSAPRPTQNKAKRPH